MWPVINAKVAINMASSAHLLTKSATHHHHTWQDSRQIHITASSAVAEHATAQSMQALARNYAVQFSLNVAEMKARLHKFQQGN